MAENSHFFKQMHWSKVSLLPHVLFMSPDVSTSLDSMEAQGDRVFLFLPLTHCLNSSKLYVMFLAPGLLFIK